MFATCRPGETLRNRANRAYALLQVRSQRLVAELRGFNPDQPRVPAGQQGAGQWTGGSGGVPARRPGSGQLRLAADIESFSKHAINRVIERGVSPEAMLDATRNPLKVVPRPDGKTQYRGRRATVVLDPFGHVITVWPQSVKSWFPAMSVHELLERVKAVLWSDWDPISINSTDAPRDEYDGYAALIVRLLQDGVSEPELANYLEEFALAQMGLPSVDRERCRHVSRRLVALWRR